MAAFEVLMASSGVRNLVRDGKSAQLRNMISTGGNFGMQTLETSLADLVNSRPGRDGRRDDRDPVPERARATPRSQHMRN